MFENLVGRRVRWNANEVAVIKLLYLPQWEYKQPFLSLSESNLHAIIRRPSGQLVEVPVSRLTLIDEEQ